MKTISACVTGFNIFEVVEEVESLKSVALSSRSDFLTLPRSRENFSW